MNNTDQQTYYSNTAASYFVPNTNMEQCKLIVRSCFLILSFVCSVLAHQFPVRNPVVYGPRMNPAPVN